MTREPQSMFRISQLAFPLAIAGILAASAAQAATPEPPEALKRNACTTCHGLTSKILGPAYSEVSKKYQGKPKAAVQLFESIRKGGSGKWGPVPMPPQPNLSDKDLTEIVDWMLAGAKK